MDRQARPDAAGEIHAVDGAVLDERFTGRPAALNQVEHAPGKSRLAPQLGGEFADAGRHFAGLEDDSVAGEEGGDDLAIGQVGGEIEWAENRDNAVRCVADDAGVSREVQRRRGAALVKRLDRDGNLADHRHHFRQRFPARLAGLAGNHLGERGLLCFESGGERVEEINPFFQREIGPRLERRPGRGHGGVHFHRGCSAAGPHALAGGGVDRDERSGFHGEDRVDTTRLASLFCGPAPRRSARCRRPSHSTPAPQWKSTGPHR